MKVTQWDQLRHCCRDQAAFEQLKQILEIGESDSEPFSIPEHLGKTLHTNVSLEQVQSKAAQLALAYERERTLGKTVEKIRQSLDVQTIFQTTTAELRSLLSADRVAVYRFNSDWNGAFVAESVGDGWKPLVGTTPIIEDTYLRQSQGGRYRNHETFVVDDIYWAGHQDCHIRLLEQFQARSYVIVPIFQGETLWGLLAAYQNSGPRNWHKDEVDLLAQIGSQFGVALQQAELFEQVQSQGAQLALVAERERTLARTVDKIRQAEDVKGIFKTTTAEVRRLLNADRVAVYQFNLDWNGTFVAESVADGWKPLVGTIPLIEDTYLRESKGGRYQYNERFVVDDIYLAGHQDCHIELLEQFQAKSYVIVPIFQGNLLWGLLAAYQNSGPRHWEAYEVEWLAQIGGHFGIALQQAEYLERVKKQTQQLSLAMDRQKTLAKTVEKIRRSLDIESLFTTTTEEVRKLLEADRVGVYQFNSDWSGSFVAESVAEGWTPLVGLMPAIRDTFLEKTQGGRYRHHENFAVENIYTAGHDECHIELLERLEAKAYVLVPIFLGEQLWGLLATYQNSGPRQWEPYEIEWLAQIGGQFSVALYQGELLAKTQQQAAELAQDLQQAQAHLVQSEKMSSLGQLVAGVAHEINNPINFIYGNLSYANEYTQDLLELVQLYTQEYPHPNPVIQQKFDEIEFEFLREDLPKIMASMRLGAERIRQLVLSLRNFSRLDESEKKPVNIHEGIESTLLILQHHLKSKADAPAIKVIKNYGQIPWVECYPAQLNQVFMNILSNAIDALEHSKVVEPTITISTQLLEGNQSELSLPHQQIEKGQPIPIHRVLIEISDNGIGIHQDAQSRIFDPFFTTKPIGQGTGLGLSISYQIVVKKHGGRLTCVSEPDQGTRFLIEVPVKQSPT